MIKKMAITVTLILVCVLVFGCSANKANDSRNIDFESEKVSFNNEFEVKDGEKTPGDDEPGTVVPDRTSYTVVLTDKTAIPSEDGFYGMPIIGTSSEKGFQFESVDVLVTVPDNYASLSIVVYELDAGNWAKSAGRNFIMGNRESVRLINAPSFTTPYYDLSEAQTISVPLTIDGEDLGLKAVLRKSGVRAITYLFANDFDKEKDVILGGYVVVSEQRNLLKEFNASYFDDPSTLPDLDENCEIFAITIELDK
jgi:hypothetical protein